MMDDDSAELVMRGCGGIVARKGKSPKWGTS
jgi:hypothetical protein